MFRKLLFITLLFVFTTSHSDQNRTALVIGNSDYTDAPLKNPTNDARDMAKTLRLLGFDVIEVINSNQQQMEQAIGSFGRKLEQKQGVGLLYYAGHGIQSKGENYLIPVGSVINRETELRYKAVNAGRILDEMSYANNGLNIAILDACRNNPLTRSFRNSARGLARISNAPKGLFLAYSTDPGNVSMDGDGRNSPFTTELLKAMQQKGLPIEQVFKQVRRNVEKQSRGKQTPFTTSSLSGDFYFVAPDGDNKVNKNQAIINELSGTVSGSLSLSILEKEDQFWNQMSVCGTESCYEAYMQTYPNGRYVAAAKALIESMRVTINSSTDDIKNTGVNKKIRLLDENQPLQISINETVNLNQFGKAMFARDGVFDRFRWRCEVIAKSKDLRQIPRGTFFEIDKPTFDLYPGGTSLGTFYAKFKANGLIDKINCSIDGDTGGPGEKLTREQVLEVLGPSFSAATAEALIEPMTVTINSSTGDIKNKGVNKTIRLLDENQPLQISTNETVSLNQFGKAMFARDGVFDRFRWRCEVIAKNKDLGQIPRGTFFEIDEPTLDIDYGTTTSGTFHWKFKANGLIDKINCSIDGDTGGPADKLAREQILEVLGPSFSRVN